MFKKSALSRRHLLNGGAAVMAACILPRRGLAATYPDQTINFIVPDSGGGSFDAYVRKFSQLIEPLFKPAVNVEPLTIPGAGGQAAVFNLLHDQPDGYNIGMLNIPGLLTAQYDKKRKPIDLSALTWVANLGRESYGVAVSAKSDIHNIADLMKQAQTRKISFFIHWIWLDGLFCDQGFCDGTGDELPAGAGLYRLIAHDDCGGARRC